MHKHEECRMSDEWWNFIDQLRATEFMKNRAEEGMCEEDFDLLTDIIASLVEAFSCGAEIEFKVALPDE